MSISWDLERPEGSAVFKLIGYLKQEDNERLEGATAWVAARTQSVVLDLSQLLGCGPRAEKMLTRCVKVLAPTVVVCGENPDRLHLHGNCFPGILHVETETEALLALAQT